MNRKLYRSIGLGISVITLMGFLAPVTQTIVPAHAMTTTMGNVTKSSDATAGITNSTVINSEGLPDVLRAPDEAPISGQPGALMNLAGNHNTPSLNARDLGGYRTADGKWQVRSQKLLRSADLSTLSDDDIQALTTMKVKSIIDFRTKSQIAKAPDKTISGTKTTNISIFGASAESDGGGDAGFYKRQLSYGYFAVNGYRQFLNQLLTQNGPTLYHCNAGKDRTGIATVLIMTALGMDRNTIINDYLLSQTYGRNVSFTWLKVYLDNITANDHSVNDYLVNVLGFTPYQQEQLRAKYLVSTDGKNTSYPEPQAPVTPMPEPEPSLTVPTVPDPEEPEKPDITQPITPTPKPKKKQNVQIISVKKVQKKQFVHTKNKRAYFYDMHLKHQVGYTAKNSKTKWRILKKAKMKVNGKTKTYVQVKSPHGYHRWIQLSDVKTI